MKTLILEFDDFHWKNPENCLQVIEKLVFKFPKIKISLFTVPLLENLSLHLNEEWVKKVKHFIFLQNIKLAVHGLYHTSEEFKFLKEQEIRNRLFIAHSIFDKCNLPFVKIFRGPHWGINEDTIKVLNDFGYTHLYNHENYRYLESKFSGKVVYYNWNLKDQAPEADVLIAHGHTHNVCGNGIDEITYRITDFIEKHDPVFKFVDEI